MSRQYHCTGCGGYFDSRESHACANIHGRWIEPKVSEQDAQDIKETRDEEHRRFANNPHIGHGNA